jgi:hypothetical protein
MFTAVTGRQRGAGLPCDFQFFVVVRSRGESMSSTYFSLCTDRSCDRDSKCQVGCDVVEGVPLTYPNVWPVVFCIRANQEDCDLL